MSDHLCSTCGGNLAGGEERPCTCRRRANRQTVAIRDLNAGQRCMVHGRDLHKPTATLTVCQDGVASIRVDDDGNPEFWLTVELTREQVMWLADKMRH